MTLHNRFREVNTVYPQNSRCRWRRRRESRSNKPKKNIIKLGSAASEFNGWRIEDGCTLLHYSCRTSHVIHTFRYVVLVSLSNVICLSFVLGYKEKGRNFYCMCLAEGRLVRHKLSRLRCAGCVMCVIFGYESDKTATADTERQSSRFKRKRGQ